MSEISGRMVDSVDDVELESAHAEPTSTTPSDDVVFEILTNSRRRAILRYLDDASDGATKGELADQIAAEENDKSVDELRSQERKRVYVSLYQFHLPKMESTGVIRIENDRTVRLDDGADRCFEYLDKPDVKSRWYRSYLALSFVAVLGYASGSLSNSIPWTGVLIGAFLLLSLLHWLDATTPHVDSVRDAFTRRK